MGFGLPIELAIPSNCPFQLYDLTNLKRAHFAKQANRIYSGKWMFLVPLLVYCYNVLTSTLEGTQNLIQMQNMVQKNNYFLGASLMTLQALIA